MSTSPTPFDAATFCFCLAASKAARALARRYDEALRPIGLTNGQFSILVGVALELPVGLSELADALGMDRTTLTAALKPLDRQGLVSITPDPKDARLRRLRLTERGKDIVATALPIWAEVQADVSARSGGVDVLGMLNRVSV